MEEKRSRDDTASILGPRCLAALALTLFIIRLSFRIFFFGSDLTFFRISVFVYFFYILFLFMFNSCKHFFVTIFCAKKNLFIFLIYYLSLFLSHPLCLCLSWLNPRI